MKVCNIEIPDATEAEMEYIRNYEREHGIPFTEEMVILAVMMMRMDVEQREKAIALLEATGAE